MTIILGITPSCPLCRQLKWLAGILLLTGFLVMWPASPIPGIEEKNKLSDAQVKKQTAESLEKLTLALIDYADGHRGQMPPAAVHSKEGKPLYSWRVLVLPNLGEKKLYEQFKLAEPWDSPDNKKLLEKMPKVFAPVEGAASKKHSTHFQVFVGPEAPFSQKNVGPRYPASFPDGTSNTILVAEAGETVPWTSPRDLAYDAKKPIPKLGGLSAGGFHIGLADGSIHFVKPAKLAEQTLRNAITPADGMVLGSDWEEALK